MFLSVSSAIVVLLLLLSSCCLVRVESFNLTILHNNDIHSHFAQINEWGSPCDTSSVTINDTKCFGGVARIVAKLKEIRESDANKVLFLNAGDNFQGTVLYTLFKWEVVAKFVKLLNFDAMALGNHEFDDGIEGLAPFIDELSATQLPILSCNIDTSNEPRIDSKIKKSIVMSVDNHTIGIIGYITPDTAFLAKPGHSIRFTDEIQCIREEVEKLKAQGVNILIALGHSGIVKDIEIATSIPDLDIVVGGHSHTFLYTGPKPSVEEIIDTYPVVVMNGTHQTLVVQAYAFSKYLGKLNLEFDEAGDIVRYDANVLLLDHTVPRDETVAREVEAYETRVKAKYSSVVGETRVLLDGSSCRMRECNLGNLITDAMVDFYLQRAANPTNNGWTNTAIAVYVGGGIRSTIDERHNNGSITLEDLITVLPFNNQLVIVVISGSKIKELLEHSVTLYDITGRNQNGRFAQISGLLVKYNLSEPELNRVMDVRVRCADDCRIPQFVALNETASYRVIVPKYMVDGGDDYHMLSGNDVQQIISDDLDLQVFSDYVKHRSPLYHGLEQRITFA